MKTIPHWMTILLCTFWCAFADNPPAYEVRIEFDVGVRMRDGTRLSADIYRPNTNGRFPVLLSRSPYLKTAASALKTGRYFATHGYVVVQMDVRGRGDSEGEFTPYRNDGRDGYDAVEWCAKQPWSSGKIGTIGGSYLARIQWLTAIERPPHLVTMAATVTPSDPFVEWPTGLPLPMDISWHFSTSGRVAQNMDAVNWPEVHHHLPLLTMDEAAGRIMPRWREMIDHARLDDYWSPLRYQDKFNRIDLPVLHISGWYDDEQIGTPLNFIGMTTNAATATARRNQKMIMGPWPHNVNSSTKLGIMEFGPTAVVDLDAYRLRWFDYWLKDAANGIMDEPPVRLFSMGENRWVEEDGWPIPRTAWTKYYLHSRGRANSRFGDGTLSATGPAEEPVDTYTSDPADPVPFITEPTYSQIGSADDYQSVERRDDVLVYSTPPLAENTLVCGPIRVKLYAASTAKDTDFTAKLLDVWPNGVAQRLTDGIVRARFRDGMERPALIEPGRVYPYDIDCWNTCQMYLKGHRIRLEVASSAFPKYDRNPSTGEALGRSVNGQTALQTIHHDRARESYVLLPVVKSKPESLKPW